MAAERISQVAENEKLDRLNSVEIASAIHFYRNRHIENFSINFKRFHFEIKVRFELLKTRHYTQSIKLRVFHDAAEQ